MSRPLRITLLAMVAGVLGLAVYVDFPLCPLASGFGIPCPGCGLTRATLSLLHGDVRTALHFHPLVWLLAPLFAGFMGVALLELLRDPARPLQSPPFRWHGRGTNIAAWCLLVLVVGVWLARFAGYFGGPVPVTSMSQWLSERAHVRR